MKHSNDMNDDDTVVCSRYFLHDRTCLECPHQNPHKLHDFDNDRYIKKYLRECSGSLQRCLCLPVNVQAVRCMRARLLNLDVDGDKPNPETGI